MMKFKWLAGIVVAFLVFLSGKAPYSLIYTQAGLQSLGLDTDAISASDITCELDKPEGYKVGEQLSGDFSIRLQNHTDRIMLVTVVGEILPPKGYGTLNYKNLVLMPDDGDLVKFGSQTRFVGTGKYTCDVRYNVGWGESV